MRQDLGTFTAKVFSTVSPGDNYLHNWHIDAVSHALMQIHHGKNRRLIVTQPPRSLKSICTSVSFVAWSLGHDPSMRFACVSYSHELAASFARQFRTVVTSEWYRALFPKMRLSKDTETECVTTKNGGRFVVPVGGSFTGRGADVIIIDDPLKADDGPSDKARRVINDWFPTTVLSQLDDKQKGAIIVVAQRLHEDDLPGRLLTEGGWHHLDLPAIAQEDQEIPIGPDAVHRRRKGEALHPEREPLALLEGIKREMGSLTFSAQYLQRPVPPEGNLIKRGWIKWYDSPPARTTGAQVVQSWDVASTTGDARDSVGVHNLAIVQTKLLSARCLARTAGVSSLEASADRRCTRSCAQSHPHRAGGSRAAPYSGVQGEPCAGRAHTHWHQARRGQASADGSSMRAL